MVFVNHHSFFAEKEVLGKGNKMKTNLQNRQNELSTQLSFGGGSRGREQEAVTPIREIETPSFHLQDANGQDSAQTTMHTAIWQDGSITQSWTAVL